MKISGLALLLYTVGIRGRWFVVTQEDTIDMHAAQLICRIRLTIHLQVADPGPPWERFQPWLLHRQILRTISQITLFAAAEMKRSKKARSFGAMIG